MLKMLDFSEENNTVPLLEALELSDEFDRLGDDPELITGIRHYSDTEDDYSLDPDFLFDMSTEETITDINLL